MAEHTAGNNSEPETLVARRFLIWGLRVGPFSPTERRSYVDEPLRRLALTPISCS